MKTPVILLGHGSRNITAHAEFLALRDYVQQVEPDREIHLAYLQLMQPDLFTAVSQIMSAPVKREIIIIPVFLLFGNHIREDIPELLQKVKTSFPAVEFFLGRHLGPDQGVARLVVDRINEVAYRKDFLANPQEIETESFRIIETELARLKIHKDLGEREVLKRVIHTTADLGMAEILDFHPQAVAAGIKALQEGARIVTDVKMSLMGIGKLPAERFGCSLECYIDDPHIAILAKETGKTRAMSAIHQACKEMNGGIVVIGNAPTALFELCEMVLAGVTRPDLVVATPVGFVGAAESKEVVKSIGIPYIRTVGPRGGSPIAASIVNALSRLAEAGE